MSALGPVSRGHEERAAECGHVPSIAEAGPLDAGACAGINLQDLILDTQRCACDGILDHAGISLNKRCVARGSVTEGLGRWQALATMVEWIEIKWQHVPINQAEVVASGLPPVGGGRGNSGVDKRTVRQRHEQALAAAIARVGNRCRANDSPVHVRLEARERSS
eukprot:1466106-Prymnesium_polylepis.1